MPKTCKGVQKSEHRNFISNKVRNENKKQTAPEVNKGPVTKAHGSKI